MLNIHCDVDLVKLIKGTGVNLSTYTKKAFNNFTLFGETTETC